MDNAKWEQIEYLFLDIEWNQAPGTNGLDDCEPVQIGAVAADPDLQKIKIFSKGIRLSNPDRYNPETGKITHIPITNVMQCKSEKTVLKNFSITFPRYRYIVVWTKDTYDLFKRGMEKYRIPMRRHKLIILQEILGIIAGNSNRRFRFEKALECAGIEYVPDHLHYSKHDSNYLYQLFCQCYLQYTNITANEYCIANTVTRKMHAPDCSYAKSISPERKGMFPKNAIFKSFTICKYCKKKQGWNLFQWKYESKFEKKQEKEKKTTRDSENKTGKSPEVQNQNYRDKLKKLPLTEVNIGKICKWFRLSYSISVDMVFIRTPFASWIVYLHGNQVRKLFHENYKMRKSLYLKKQKMKCEEGYHKQKLPSQNFFEVIQYITRHDGGMAKRMLKKNRLEKLLEEVETELRLKGREVDDYGNEYVSEL